MEKLKPYTIKFEKDDKIKLKVYSSNCVIVGNKQHSIIIITYNKYTFFAKYKI